MFRSLCVVIDTDEQPADITVGTAEEGVTASGSVQGVILGDGHRLENCDIRMIRSTAEIEETPMRAIFGTVDADQEDTLPEKYFANVVGGLEHHLGAGILARAGYSPELLVDMLDESEDAHSLAREFARLVRALPENRIGETCRPADVS